MWFLSVHVHRLIPCPNPRVVALSMGPGLAGLRCLGMSPNSWACCKLSQFFACLRYDAFLKPQILPIFPRRLPSCGSSQGRCSMSRSSFSMFWIRTWQINRSSLIDISWHILWGKCPHNECSYSHCGCFKHPGWWMFYMWSSTWPKLEGPPVLLVGFEQPHQHPSTSLIYLSKSLVSLLN